MSELVETNNMRKAVIRFSGDSGDGMQLTGELFSQSSAIAGHDLATIPDFPAEIRAPQGSLEGVSSFQVQLGGIEIYTPGDQVDVLIAMNPAAFKTNLKHLKPGGTIIADVDNFSKKNLKKASYEDNPLSDEELRKEYHIVEAPVTSMTKEALKHLEMDMQSMMRSKNMMALGIVLYFFRRSIDNTITFLQNKFKNKPKVAEANVEALKAGYNFAESTELLGPSVVIPPAEIPEGTYRNIDGNTATAWGLLAAAEKCNKQLSLCSYPITPASEILHEISLRKDVGAISFQAEDEIAAICSAIGASFSGNLGVTTTSGPGASLKTEAMGLAMIAEIPLVIVNVQRVGPSTGLPTKSEQSDLLQALYGRHGESPVVVMAASSPDDCFYYSYMACKLAIEHTTPVILLTDSYLASGSHPWRIPNMDDLPDITVPQFDGESGEWQPYLRDPEYMNRYWMAPGTRGFEHRIGGLEKAEITGNVTYDGENHEKMVRVRADKIKRVTGKIPDQKVFGAESGKLLLVGWGSTYGALHTALQELEDEGVEGLGLTHFNYLFPMPENIPDIFSKFDKILICELNNGQLATYLRSQHPEFTYHQFNRMQARAFFVSEIKNEALTYLES